LTFVTFVAVVLGNPVSGRGATKVTKVKNVPEEAA
jgi:hypothetical protein